jgi:hypothetical protein
LTALLKTSIIPSCSDGFDGLVKTVKTFNYPSLDLTVLTALCQNRQLSLSRPDGFADFDKTVKTVKTAGR